MQTAFSCLLMVKLCILTSTNIIEPLGVSVGSELMIGSDSVSNRESTAANDGLTELLASVVARALH